MNEQPRSIMAILCEDCRVLQPVTLKCTYCGSVKIQALYWDELVKARDDSRDAASNARQEEK